MQDICEDMGYCFIPGDGRPLVFLHGWLEDHTTWERILDQLETDRPVLLYDHRGHGDSISGPFDMHVLADDLKRLLDALELQDPVLIGRSLGGMVALQYAADHDDLAGFIIIGAGARTPEPENESPAYFLTQFGEMDRAKWAEQIADNYAPPDRFRAATVELLANADEQTIRSGLQAMIDYDVRDRLPDVAVPALVIAGEHDAAITPEQSREVADLLNCPITFLDASHLIIEEHPAAVAAHIAAFIDRTGL